MTVNDKMPADLNTILEKAKKNIFSTLNCIQIGQITAVDDTTNTVQVQLQIKRASEDGSLSEIPLLTDVPYIILQGGGSYIDLPIAIDDYCLVLFNDRDIDTWWTTANETIPNSIRKHHLSDGIALVGINPSTKILDKDGTLVRILGTSGSDSDDIAAAARTGDEVKSTSDEDSAFWTFISGFINLFSSWTVVAEDGGAALKTLITTYLASNTVPTSLTGKITGGSSEVEIG